MLGWCSFIYLEYQKCLTSSWLMMIIIKSMTASNDQPNGALNYHYPLFASDVFAHSLPASEKRALKKKNKELAKKGKKLFKAASAALAD